MACALGDETLKSFLGLSAGAVQFLMSASGSGVGIGNFGGDGSDIASGHILWRHFIASLGQKGGSLCFAEHETLPVLDQ